MKKLFILTVLLSAKLFAASPEAEASLAAVQKAHAGSHARATELGKQIQYQHSVTKQDPTPENSAKLQELINRQAQEVENCKKEVHNLQATLKHLNERGEHFNGRVFTTAA